MIKINNKIFDNLKFKVNWKEFTIVSNNKETTITPNLIFNTKEIFITIETTLSKNQLESIKPNIKTNIKEYINDISYEDKKGWISINDGDYNCYLTKLDNEKFHIDFNIISNDIDEEFNIIIDEDINL